MWVNWTGPLLQSRVMAKIPVVGKGLNMETNEILEQRSEKILLTGLDLVETVMLSGPGKFLENGDEVSLADIVLLCQLKQLKVLPKYDPKMYQLVLQFLFLQCSEIIAVHYMLRTEMSKHSKNRNGIVTLKHSLFIFIFT